MQKPITIERTAWLAEAHRVMRQHQIRHPPVLEGGNLVGIVTQRDAPGGSRRTADFLRID